ncbi:U4/U6.U5 tri-snRNP-associated protein 1 [Anthonomus grandis grandis]|uniref:U4/U6.U5 tri-snRNP-associated protein 1 n=1 Tax=Anthonomus grandis grandis TaxID=2921223 RepID=UPI002165219F|nr:U4/U6.U5 tri-snRNP-associated protein 1 [Anthonomus grandis grandis]
MGSSSKSKYKEKESSRPSKRRHGSPSDEYDAPREKRHKHKHRHHKEKRRERSKERARQNSDDDVIEVIPDTEYPIETSSKHESKYDRDSKYESRDSKYESRESKYESKESKYESRASKYESRESKYEPREPKYDSREIKYDSKAESKRESHQDSKSADASSGQGGSQDTLSIDETNKLRAQLGLKPLEVQTETSNDGKKKDDLGEFYHKPAENWAQKAEREKIRAKIAEHKEKRMLQSKFSKVKTLGESDSEDDVSNWVDRNRKIEKAKLEAEKRAKMLEEMDAQFGIGDIIEQEQKERRNRQYTQKDLRGLKVQHDIGSIAEEKQVILTLKDSGVLDNEDDVLVNVNMIDNERYTKNVENKKKKILYNAYEDQEYDEFGNPKEKSLLSKYDEEIDGEKRDSFRIGEDDKLLAKKAAVVQSVKDKLAKKRLESIAEKNLVLASEYYNEEELAKFKKPKKKTRRIRAKGKLTAEDLISSQQIEQIGSRRNKLKVEANEPDISIDDVPDVVIPTDIKLEDDKDDLLEKALHKARKMKQKETIIADLLKIEPKEEPEDDTGIDSGNIILNSTAEFCRTLGDIPTYGKAGNRDEAEDLLDYEKEGMNDEKSDDECQIIEPTGWNSVDTKAQELDLGRLAPQEVQILDEEPDVSTGVGAALKLAMSKGYLDKEQNNRPSNSRFAHLQAQNYSIEDKNYGEEGNERGGRGSGRERYSGPIQEFREKESFKPNVKLEYIDDDGHILNSKEAFRYLSHKFHGKGPGKNKVEKRIKKSVQEQLMKKMSSTDTPLGTLNMLQAKQKETQSPFVVLSGSKQQQTAISKSRR